MTREEAHLQISEIVEHLIDYQDNYGKINNLVNKIYNYFEAQQPKQQAIKVQVPNEYSNINQDAFNEWMKYKKYKNKGAITKTLNMLNKYDYQTQQEMVDKSIMNEYKGLFEPKQNQKQKNDKQVNAALDNNVFDLIEQRAEENRQSAEEYYSLTTDIGTKHG